MAKSNSILRLALITCFAHHGYRRAGVGFCEGENKFHADDFSESQLKQLEDDPRLKLELVDVEPHELAAASSADALQGHLADDTFSLEKVGSQTNETKQDEGTLVGDGLGVTSPEGGADKLAIKALSFAEAVIQLEPGNKEHFTGDGKPQCDVLSKLMGEPVSASERDALWSAFKAEQAPNQEAE